ncbi:MAG: PPC domain-containing DNA-binding protein [Bacilli bacterium]
MEYKKFNNKYIVRIDKQEEILETLFNFCKQENIFLGTVNGIGAVNDITIGLFDTVNKKYNSEQFKKDFEIVSLVGNISKMKNEIYLHMHMSVSDSNYNVIGGHLNKAYVSATCEVIIEKIDGEVNREFNEQIGLNLYKFN